MTKSALMEKRTALHGTEAPEKGFGPHLMLDCKGCNPKKIDDVAHIFNVLNELPERIGMTKITQPYVFPYSGLVPEDKGVTGIVIIAESHLSFHSFTEKDYFFFDLFSCKPFDVEAAMQYIIDAFEVQDAEVHYVERGTDFPRSEAPKPIALTPTDRVRHLNDAELDRQPIPAVV